MLHILYNFGLQIASFILKLPLPYSSKMKEWIVAQNNIWATIQTLPTNAIWVHVASSGEFEQIREVIHILKQNNEKVIVSFFSPSGYNAQKNNESLDGIFYLPIDTNANMQRLVTMLQPKLIVLVKYEFWLNLMTIANKKSIPIVLASGSFRPTQFLFNWFGKNHFNQIKKFSFISVQDAESKMVLNSYNVLAEVTGDSRVDRALQLPSQSFDDKKLETFTNNNAITIMIGSAWVKDIELFLEIWPTLKKRGTQLIIAPHELTPSFIQTIKTKFDADLYTSQLAPTTQCLILDTIGILKYAYRYVDIAYIGGGFGKGIHNTLEPATYGKPIIFGPNYKQFIEAKMFVKREAAFAVHNSNELLKIIAYLYKDNNREQASLQALNYLHKNRGASKKIAERIFEILSEN